MAVLYSKTSASAQLCYTSSLAHIFTIGLIMRIYKAKAPMRIGFFGGGTDVSPYAEEHGGKVINCTIDKYVRCMLRPSGEYVTKLIPSCRSVGSTASASSR